MSTNDPTAKLFNPHAPSGVTIVNPGSSYITNPSFITAGSGCATTTFATTSYAYSPDMQVSGTVNAKDFKVDGISLKDTLEKIQDRLAILDEPNPEKLEKYAALKNLYDQYKMMEALIAEDNLHKKE